MMTFRRKAVINAKTNKFPLQSDMFIDRHGHTIDFAITGLTLSNLLRLNQMLYAVYLVILL